MTATGTGASGSGPRPLDETLVRRLAAAALAEDVGHADITTQALVPAAARARGRIVARQACTVCGLAFAREVFRALDPDCSWREVTADGGRVEAGALIASVEGSARAILTGERTALNFLQRLSGIATLARRAVEEVEGTGATILDTRKTTPTLREIEKYAVRSGGAVNHRTGLFDAVLIKDNHVALCGGIREAMHRARQSGLPIEAIEIEVDDPAGVREALDAGACRILLDNFTPSAVAGAVREIAGRARIEVSGGLRPGSLRAYAEAGADFLSIGGLTHSATAVDLSLELDSLP